MEVERVRDALPQPPEEFVADNRRGWNEWWENYRQSESPTSSTTRKRSLATMRTERSVRKVEDRRKKRKKS